MINIHLILNIIYFNLNIIEWPLLRLLHLNHHLLNLLKLLEIICLHFFNLFLLRYQHVQTILIFPKILMLYSILTWRLQTWFWILNPAFVKFILLLNNLIWLYLLILLIWLIVLISIKYHLNTQRWLPTIFLNNIILKLIFTICFIYHLL